MSEREIHYDEIAKGKCGLCKRPIGPQYLWCDECEDKVERIQGTIRWRVLSEPERRQP